MEEIKNELLMKKIISNINPNIKIIYDQAEENEVFFAAENQIVRYNFKTGFVISRNKISNKKITKLLPVQSNSEYTTSSANTFACLTKNNQFILYNLDKKTVINTFDFESESVIDFIFSQFFNSYIFLTKSSRLIFLTQKKREENFTIEKEVNIKETEGEVLNKTAFLEIKDKILMFSSKNKLILHNLLTSNSKVLEFKRNLTSGIFLEEDKLVVGDSSGKLHFISNLNEKKQVTATKHWHSHKVTAIETDPNYEYLYTAGEEGVIVVWNLRTEAKNFLPRMNGEITSLSLSPNSQMLCLVTKDNTLKCINLSNMSILNEYFGVCLKKTQTENSINQHVNSMADNIRLFNIKQDNFSLIFDSDTGRIQIVNINNGKILSNSSLLFKNFISQTEKESINNRRLINVEINSPEINYMVTYEEITDDLDKNFLISYLKFWKVINIKENFSIELISIAENAHNNEKVKGISFHNGRCTTFGEKSFKLWEFQKDTFTCAFTGSYRNETISNLKTTDKNDKIMSLHGNKYLVEWDISKKGISRVYIFENLPSEMNIVVTNNVDDSLLLYNSQSLLHFSTKHWDVVWTENLEEYSVVKSSVCIDNRGKAWVILQNRLNPAEFIIYGINLDYRNCEIEDCFYLKKNNISYINLWKNSTSLIILNSNLEILVTKKNSMLGKKLSKRDDGSSVEDISDFVPYNIKKKAITQDDDDFEMI